jgi:chorismate mutase
MFKATLQPEDWPYVKRRMLLLEQAKAHDLPEEMFEDEEKAQATIDAQQQVQQKQMEDQAAVVHAQVEEMLGRAFAHAAKARKDDASINVDVFQAIMDGLRADGEQTVQAAKAAAALRPKPAPTGGSK